MIVSTLARKDVRCILAVTDEQFGACLRGDALANRTFQVLPIEEPTEEKTLQICREWAKRIEGTRDVVYDDEALITCVSLSRKFIDGSAPDTTIDLLESAASFVCINTLTSRSTSMKKGRPTIGRREIEAVLEEQYGIIINAVRQYDEARLRKMLAGTLRGQNDAILDIISALDTLAKRRRSKNRPVGVLIFAGPPATGKSVAAEHIGMELFGSGEGVLLSLNINEHETDAVKATLFRYAVTHTRGIILLRNMDGAGPEVCDFFQGIFKAGFARDHLGRKLFFHGHLFVLSYTVRAHEHEKAPIGFRTPMIARSARGTIRCSPALAGVASGVITFRQLTSEEDSSSRRTLT